MEKKEQYILAGGRSNLRVHSDAPKAARDARVMQQNLRKAILIAVFVLLPACSEQYYHFFRTGEEALSSDVSNRGWVPEWLPRAAYQIQLQYDIDSNNRWLRFKLPQGENERIIREFFNKLTWEQVKQIPAPRPRRADWWFEGLIQQQPANDGALNADIYVGNGTRIPRNAYLAVSKTDDSIYLWIEGQ